MEVAIGNNGASTPFQREVREWQHIDPNTGALLTGRLEADRWINGPLNTYGKVVDSQNVSQPNGTQHSQRKQLEVLQARTAAGSMQVIRAQTVQRTSSRWSSGTTATTATSQSFDNQRYPILTNGIGSSCTSRSDNSGNTSQNTNQTIQTGDLQNNNNRNSSSNQANNYHKTSSNFSILTNGNDKSQQHHNHKMTPSLKLSNLMKSSTTSNCNGGSPHSFTNNSMSLVQRQQSSNSNSSSSSSQQRQKHANENGTRTLGVHDITNIVYQQHPTNDRGVGVVVGGGFDYATQEHQPNQQIRNNCTERETDFYMQRGRSVSIDDLATDWAENNNDANDESCEWRRVSKIRRSFQCPKSQSPPNRHGPIRPIDLPEISISVSKIRQELENGRRLNTAMRNNHVDLAALDTILNSSSDTELSPKSAKKAAFLTAESLKEIRGKLKKLSDESLYKDDFITIKKDMPILETTENGQLQLPDESSPQSSVFQFHPKAHQPTANHTTNSLENRTRFRDTSSTEWHLRRKSYGFEKMSPPDTKSMFRQETSTDSGIGRSSELSNWSPTEAARGTVIKFGETSVQAKNSTTVVLNGRSESPKPPIVQRRLRGNDLDLMEIKRHSIAVDETKYVRDNLRKVFDTKTSIHLNGLYPKETNCINDELVRQRKRVEFCKTEVHFAAESGRVNIVETDGKPPPTNNFRRRRRSSGNTYLDAITSGLQIMHFGDDKKTTIFEQDSEQQSDELQTIKNNVTVSVPIVNGHNFNNQDGANSKDGQDESDPDEISLRGILKNKPVKPKPYHLGENIDKSDSLWGVRLKPVILGSNNNEIELIPTSISSSDNKTNEIMTEKELVTSATVADRVKIVEERKDGTGYSTKINLNLTDTPFVWNSDSESVKTLKSSSSSHSIENANHSLSKNNDRALKSTSLIMRQMRSTTNPNQIDDDTKSTRNFQSIRKPTTTTGPAITTNATRLISNMAAITKSNSANSIFIEKERIYRPKYSSSLDGDTILNDDTFYMAEKLIKSSSISSTGSCSSYIYDGPGAGQQQQSRTMAVLQEEPTLIKRPIAAPRVKINNQLVQQRRFFTDHGGCESDDSAKADDEVKRFLEGTTSAANQTDHETITASPVDLAAGSWSRIKAQRIVKKSKIDVKGKNDDKTARQVPRSNVMSIELRSPLATLKKPIVPEDNGPAKVPVAKPRTTIKSSHTTENNAFAKRQKEEETQNTTNQHHNQYNSQSVTDEIISAVVSKEPLKIVTAANGARKLRDHELSYFGVKIKNSDANPTQKLQRNTNTEYTNRKSTNNINQKHHEDILAPNVVTTKWKLSSDKPDLLRHSPVVNKSSPIIVNLKDESPAKICPDINGPLYENLQKPSNYNRNKDLERDELILSEMNQTADQTMKTVSDRHKSQDERYQRQVERRQSKPLDTIDEKRSTRTPFDLESEEKHKSQLENFQRKCCSRRSSSASSTGSISDSGSLRGTRSRSRSRERLDYKPVKPSVKKTSSPAAVAVRNQTEHRSSSRDTQKSHNSSSENLAPLKLERKSKRSSNTLKVDSFPAASNRIESTSSRSSIDKKESRHRQKSATRSSNDKTESNDRNKSSSTRVSSHPETSDRHKHNSRSYHSDHKDATGHRSSQRSSHDPAESRRHTKISSSDGANERNRSEDRHRISSSISSKRSHPRTENSKTKTSSPSGNDYHQKHRSATRSSGVNVAAINPLSVDSHSINNHQNTSTTKTSLSGRHHRSSTNNSREHIRK